RICARRNWSRLGRRNAAFPMALPVYFHITANGRVLERLFRPTSSSLNEESARKLIGLKADRKAQERVAELARKMQRGRASHPCRSIPARVNAMMKAGWHGVSPDRLLPRRPAAVDSQVLAGHVAAGVAGQEDDGAFEFPRFAHSSHRQLLTQSLYHRGGSF